VTNKLKKQLKLPDSPLYCTHCQA